MLLLVVHLSVDPALSRCNERGLFLFLREFATVDKKLYVYFEMVSLLIGGNRYVPLAHPLFKYRSDKWMVDIDAVIPRIRTGRQYNRIAGDFLEYPLRVSVDLTRHTHRKSAQGPLR